MHEAPKARRVRGRGGVIRCGAPRCSVVRFVPRALGHGDHPVGRQHARSRNVRSSTFFLPSRQSTDIFSRRLITFRFIRELFFRPDFSREKENRLSTQS